MADEKVNNQEVQAPVEETGTTSTMAGGTEDYSSLSDEQLEAVVKSIGQTVAKPEEEVVSEEPSKPDETVEVERELPENLKGKTLEEVVDMYLNLQKLHGAHANELGELRRFKQEQEELERQAEQYQLNPIVEEITREIKDMSQEEKDAFLIKLSENPVDTIGSVVKQQLFPLLVQQAKYIHERKVQELKESTKNSLVPYNEKEINKIIKSYNKNGRNELFDKYGSGAFDVAYDIYFKNNVEAAVQKKLEESKKGETMKKQNPDLYVEPPSVSTRASSTGGTPDFSKVKDNDLAKMLGAPPLAEN